MKKIILILLCFTLTGCYNYQEINDLAIVTSLAIDYEDDMYNVSAQVIDFKDGKEVPVIFSEKGNTVYEALRSMSEFSSKRIYISHLELLVLSKEVFKNFQPESINFLSNYPDSGINFYVIVSDDKAKTIIETLSTLNNISAEAITDTLTLNSKYESEAYLDTFDTYLSDILSKGKSPILPYVEILENQKPSKENKEERLIKLNGLISSNGKNIIRLSKNESIGYNFLSKEIANTVITSKCDNGYYTIELKWNDTKIKVDSINEITVDINSFGTIGDINCDLNPSKKTEDFIKEETTKKVKDYINKTIKLSIDNKIDFIGFGSKISTKYYNYFESIKDDWENKYLDKLKVNVNVNIDINKLGNLNKNIKGSDNN